MLPADRAMPGHTTIPHELRLPDPTRPDLPEQAYTIHQRFESAGNPVGFRFHLSGVVCLEEVCEPLDVILYWDAFGRFKKLVTPPGKPLTKNEHEPFTENDYQMLDRLLRNPHTVLADYTYKDIAFPPDAVDGVSGATPTTVQAVVVPGAAYTSWVLWHWVNGALPPLLRAFTQASTSPDFYAEQLGSDDPDALFYTLQWLAEETFHDARMYDALLDVLSASSDIITELALKAISQHAPSADRLHQDIARIAGQRSSSVHQLLAYLEKASPLSIETLEILAQAIPSLDALDALDAFEIFEQNQTTSTQLVAMVAQLTDHDDPFLAHRARAYVKQHQRK